MSVTYARLGSTITSPRTYARRPVRERLLERYGHGGPHFQWVPE